MSRTLMRSFRGLATAFLAIAIFTGGPKADSVYSQNLSLPGFPSNEFFGGVSVDLDGLRNHPRYQLLPLDELIPGTTSFDYLDDELISEFAFFLKDGSQSNQGSNQNFEIAAIGKLRDPSSFDAKKELTAWKNRTTPWRSDAVDIEEIQLDGKPCFRFPTGTIFNSIQRTCEIQFYDSDGKKKDNGTNVGNQAGRGYISGRGKEKAVFTFADLASTDLIDGEISIDIFLDVYLAGRQAIPKAQIFLQTPDGKLRSSLVNFEAESLAHHRFTFPRELPVFDTTSGVEKGTVDLIDDFASEGQLQVVLRCHEKLTYIGVKDSDIGLQLPRHEYLGLNGEFVVVAQSMDSLKQMLKLTPRQIAAGITRQANQQASASFDLSEPENQLAFKDFLTTMNLEPVIPTIKPSSGNVGFSVNMDQDRIVSARIGMPFSDAKSGSKEITEACQKKIPGELAEDVYQFVLRSDSLANVGTLIMSYLTRLSPEQGGPRSLWLLQTDSDVALFPNRSVDRKSLARVNQAFFENLASSLHTQGNSKGLRIELYWPFDEPDQLKPMDRFLIGILQRYLANGHFEQKRFYLAEQIERRLINRFPKEDGLWRALSHQISFNTSMDFEDDAVKYFWVRRGINILLDVAEADDGSSDALDRAAFFIGFKIGASDEHESFHKLFVNDRELLERISKHVDLNQCLDFDGNISCLLVARKMMDLNTSRNEMWLQPLLSPVSLLALHARRLDSQLNFQAANKYWRQALEEFQQLGEHVIQYDSGTKVKINELKSVAAKLSEQDVSDNAMRIREDLSWYESTKSAYKLRLSADGEAACIHLSKAIALHKSASPDQAVAQTKMALKIVRQMLSQEPESRRTLYYLFENLLFKVEKHHGKHDESVSDEVQQLRLKLK